MTIRGATGPVVPRASIRTALRLSGLHLPAVGMARVYACGITPYDVTHLGHAATFVWADPLSSVWRMCGVETVACRNVTDVDDVLTRAGPGGTRNARRSPCRC